MNFKRPALRSRLGRAVWIGLALLLILSSLPWLAPQWWFADLCSHFRIQAAALGIVAALMLLWRRLWRAAAAAVLIFVIDVTALAPLFASTPAPIDAPASARALRVAFSNVFYRNPHVDRVIRFALESDADVIVFAEITPAWNAALAPLAQRYPYRHYAFLPGQRRAGTLLVSRLPLESARTIGFGRTGDPAVQAQVRAGGRLFHLIGAHPTWPLWRIATHNRDAQYAQLGAIARAAGADTILIGDFNATPFSPAFERFIAGAGLRDASMGRWMPTWPTFFPPLYLQIDHALISADLRVSNFARGTGVGSDHLPIVLDVAQEVSVSRTASR